TGAIMGDDANMGSNFPLAAVLDSSLHVSYFPTHGFSQMAPGAGTAGYFFFNVPPGTPSGLHSLFVEANGLQAPGNGMPFSVPGVDVGPALQVVLAGT
ncbi:MAG TPA: hypothetical protein VNW92_18630, partial [Polyangiaceae bacterium]|nr:hypothetical protein [Polyangiaceae bacterium]